MNTKICKKCKIDKPFEEFHRKQASKDGYNSRCKKCRSEVNCTYDKVRDKKESEDARKRRIARSKQYDSRNKEQTKARKLKYYIKNRDKVQQANRDRYLAEQVSRKYKQQLYRSTPSGKASLAGVAARRRIRQSTGSDATLLEITKLICTKTTCFYCNIQVSDVNRNIDHFVPLAKGGTHSISNLVISCGTCNKRKSAKMPETFFKEIGKNTAVVYPEDYHTW